MGLLLILVLYIFCGITRNCGASAIVEARAMSSDQEASVEIDVDDAIDATLIKVNVLARRYGHEAARCEALLIYTRLQLPLLPAIVMFGDGQAKRSGRFGTLENLVAKLANPDQIVFVESVGTNSKVAQLIAELKKQ